MPRGEKTRRLAEGQWFWINNQVMTMTEKIGPAGLAVYMVLAFHANKKNAATIYHRTISTECGWKVTKVKEALSLLVEVGAIKLVAPSKRGLPNTYYLLRLLPGTLLAPAPSDQSHDSEPVPAPQGEVSRVATDLQNIAGSRVATEVSRVATEVGRVAATLNINKTSFNTINKTNTPQPPAEAVAGESATAEFPVPGNGKPPTRAEKVMSFREEVIDAIDVAYKAANNITDKGKVPWSPLAFVRLDKELAKYQGWELAEWRLCISNRFASDGIIPGEPPQGFIPYLNRYISGPLNQYRNLKGASNGNIGVNARAERNRAAGEQVDREISAAFARRRAEAAAHQGSSHGNS